MDIVSANNLKTMFQVILNEYYTARTSQDFSGHELGKIVRNKMREYINQLHFSYTFIAIRTKIVE